MYENDKKNGTGVFTWESGNTYHGGYKDDERHGYGEMFWTDGSSYKGEWTKGIQHGLGRMEFPDGRIKEGYFENNIYKKPATETPKLKQLKAQEILLNQGFGQKSSSPKNGPLVPRQIQQPDSGPQIVTSPDRLNNLQLNELTLSPTSNKV